MLDKVFPKIHQEGYKFIIIAVLITVVLYLISNFLGLVGLVLTIWVYYFFRDPERVSINDENYLVSPADGLVVDVLKTNGPKELGLENRNFKKISIFMNAFDCHVNRSPCSGKVSDIIYVPGKFLNASLDKASFNDAIDFPLLAVGDKSISNLELAKTISAQTQANIIFINEDSSDSYVFDNTLTQKTLNWTPKFSIEKGLMQYISWKKKQS